VCWNFFNQGKPMKKLLLGLTACAMGAAVFAAAQTALNQETLDDITKHETIAAAHSAAAKCLREGKPDAECEGALQAACKGIAIGKFCGMKH
jgi:hypothetical protein